VTEKKKNPRPARDEGLKLPWYHPNKYSLKHLTAQPVAAYCWFSRAAPKGTSLYSSVGALSAGGAFSL